MTERRKPTEQTTAHGARLRAARMERGWTQPQLSNTLAASHGIAIGQSGIARIESGERQIRLHEAVALAEVFGIHYADLVQTDAGSATPEGRRLIRAEERIARLEDQVRRLVHTLNAASGALGAYGLAVAEFKVADDEVTQP